ncbi:hypothetical protein BH11ARM1_BH11ARM1_07900 [soil metagenome]
MRRYAKPLFFAFGTAPLLLAFTQATTQQTPPTAEQVFKDIQVFKGVPASDLIPSMEFMSASLKWECANCHDPKDYSAPSGGKDAARHMILMQREINEKNFGGRLEVTCNTCHGGKERPDATPLPNNLTLRHPRFEGGPRPAEIIAKHIAEIGALKSPLVRTGTLTAPDDQTHKVESKPVVLIQANGGKFSLVSGDRKIISNGTDSWYDGQQLFEEPAFVFNRMGRSWREDAAFTGLERTTIAGKETVNKSDATVVKSPRPATSSTEDLYFDNKSGLLVRLVNARKSTLGTVVSSIDYTDYKMVDGIQVPMKVTLTFAGGEQWVMDFKESKLDPSVKDDTFTVAK